MWLEAAQILDAAFKSMIDFRGNCCTLACMKTLAILVVGLLLACGEGAKAQSSQQLFNEAQRAYVAGDIDGARQKFKTVLELDPNNTSAINYMRMINAQEKKDGGEQLEKQLKTLVLPKVEFKDATFGSALEYLKQQAAKQSDGKVKVSFVVQLPPEFPDTQRVTLNLSNIPFTEALHYLCQLAEVDYKVEKYAVIVKKKADVAAPEASPAAKAP